MKLVRFLQETLARRRRRRPTRLHRFSQRFAADLVIKPLENRIVLNGSTILPPELVLSLNTSGDLLITDASGAHNDSVTIQADSTTESYVISDPTRALDVSAIGGATLSSDGHTAYVPFASVTGDQITANLGGGNDTLTIDFTVGSFSKSIDYFGGDGDDSLAITGFGLISTYTPGNIAGSGAIVVGEQVISFSGIEPIDYDVIGGSFTLDLTGTSEDIVSIDQSSLVSDPSLDALKISGTVDGVAFENARVRNSSISITTHGGNDTVTVNGAGNNHLNSTLTINTGTESGDKIVVDGTASFSGTTTLDAPRIDLNANITNTVTGNTATTVNVTSPGQIQDGINVAAASGATVKVTAGAYAENLTIDRSLTLLGPNVGTNGASLTRLAEAEVNGTVNVTTIGSVAIKGFMINGAVTDSTAPLDLEDNIITASGDALTISGAPSATIKNNRIESTGASAVTGQTIGGSVSVTGNALLAKQTGLDLGGVSGSATIQGNAIIASGVGLKLASILGLVQIGGTGMGEANTITAGTTGMLLLAGGVMGAVTAQNNVIFALETGIDFEDGVANFTATGNEIEAGGSAGLVVNHSTSGTIRVGGLDLADKNTIFAIGSANGVRITTVRGDVFVQGNDLDSSTTGLFADHVTGNMRIQGNTITGSSSAVGIDVSVVGTGAGKSVLIGGPAASDGNVVLQLGTGLKVASAPRVTIGNNSIVSAVGGTGIILDGSLAATGVTFRSGNTITDGDTGLSIIGPNISLVGNTLNDLVLSGQSGNYITLSGGALDNQEINGTAVLFDGATGGSRTVTQNYSLEDRIVHAIDDGSVGFIRVQSGHVFVTPNSSLNPPITQANIQRAVDAAASGDTIHIQAGSYTGDIDAAAGGKDLRLTPDVGPVQVVNIGNLVLNSGDTLAMELGGTSATTDYDNFVVTGSVTLSGATLNATLLSPFVPAVGNRFTLISNDDTDAVGGTFAGMDEGEVITLGGSLFQISYQGASGNDVVLTALSATNPTLEGTPGGDDWLVVQDSLNSGIVDVYLNGNLIWSTLIAGLTTLKIDALAGNDRLTVDYVNNDPLPIGGLFYEGGTGTDALSIRGASLSTVYTPSATTNGDGSLLVTGMIGTKTISFTSVVPIDYDVAAGSFTLLLPGANDVVSLNDSTLTDGLTAALQVSGTSDLIGFASPHIRGSSLTVDTTSVAGIDAVTINSANSAHGVIDLTISEGTETGDTLNIDGAASVSGTITLSGVNVTESPGGTLTANKLLLLGKGVFLLDQANDVATLAANIDGTLAYRDVNAVSVGTVGSSSGITTTDADVKLSTVAGDLALSAAVNVGAGDLTLNVLGNVTQTAAITAAGLQIRGNGIVRLDNAANEISTLAANHTGTISYTDATDLVVGTVADTAGLVGTSASGILTDADVKLSTAAGFLAINQAIDVGGNLTLNIQGNVTQTAALTAAGLQIRGNGIVRLDNAANEITTLAANHTGTISYTDATDLVVGTVADTAGLVGTSTTGIKTNALIPTGFDVKLTAGGALTIGTLSSTAEDITLGTAGNLTLDVTGAVTQTSGNVITAAGLQLLGSVSVNLDESGNDVATLAAAYDGSITYRDANELVVGTVTDTAMAPGSTTSGIKTAGGHVKITSGGELTVDQSIDTTPGAGGVITVSNAVLNAALIAGAGNITLNGGGQDLIINVDQSSSTTLKYSADRDVIIRATVTADGPSSDTSDIIVEADANNDGVGGVWLDESPVTTDAKVVADQDISIKGSDLFATPAVADSIRVDADGPNVQVLAGRDISLVGKVISANADIFLNGVQTATSGSISVDSADLIIITSNQNAGTDVVFRDALQLANDVALNAGRDVTFVRTLDNDGSALTSSNLTITAGRDVAFYGNVGGLQPLETLTVTGAAGVFFGDADGGSADASPIISVTTIGSINIGSTSAIGGHGIVFDGDLTPSSLVTVTTTGGGDVHLNGAVRLDSDLKVVTDGTTDGSAVFTNDSPIDSQSGEFNDLVVDAGTGSVRFNEDIGATGRLGLLTVENASQVVFGESDSETPGTGTTGPVNQINADNAVNIGSDSVITKGIVFNAGPLATSQLTVTTTGDQIRLNGAVTLNSNVALDTGTGDGGHITFTSAGTIDSQGGEQNDLLLNAGTGSVFFSGNIGAVSTIGSLTVNTASGGVTFGAANTAAPGAGGPVTIVNTDDAVNIGTLTNVIEGTGITFNGGGLPDSLLTLTTTGDDIRLNGAVTLNSNVALDTGTGDGGHITFTSAGTIDSQGGEQNDLLLNAGTGSVFFSGNIGAVSTIGSLTVNTASGGVTFGAANTAAPGAGGPVTIVNTDEAVNLGTGANVIGGTGITFNGGAGTLTLRTSDDNVRLNGATFLFSNVRIDTGTGIGDVLFTNDSPIDSQSGESNNLAINTGLGIARFNEDLGAKQRLGSLTIENASQVIFGEAETETANTGSMGPVNQIRTAGAIDIGSQSVITKGILLNGGSSNLLAISTTGDSIRFNAATTLSTNVDLDTDSTGAEGGNITFTAAAPVDSGAGEANDLTADAGSGNILFMATVGATTPLDLLAVNNANDVTFMTTLHTVGHVIQADGTGTTTFNGVSGNGIGGALSLKTNNVTFSTSDMVTIGAVDVTTQNAILFGDNAGMNAGNSTIMLAANQDGSGSQGLTQSSAAMVQTTNESDQALRIMVGGNGNADISMLQVGTVSGAIRITAGGSITDNRTGEDANITAKNTVLNAGSGIGATGDADIDTAVAFLSGGTTTGDARVDERDNIQLQGLLAPGGSIVVNSGGLIDILNGTYLQSATGQVSNAPPLLRITQVNPNDVILPGDPTQEVQGTVGGIEALGDNEELGDNLTITVTWADGKASTLTGLRAGDTVVWQIGPNNESTATVTHSATASGPLNVFIQRTYPLDFLATFQSNKVEADFTVTNDSRIVLTDASMTNLNQTVPTVILTTLSNKDLIPPPIVLQVTAQPVVTEPRAVFRNEVTSVLPPQFNRLQDISLAREETQVEGATLFLMAVGPDGQEGSKVDLYVSELSNLSGLLERLRKAQIPSGLYRLYYQEPGLPAQMVLEFRKTGNNIGDPVREPGRGTNPIESQPGQPQVPQDQSMGQWQAPAPESRETQLESALVHAAHQSFNRAARLLRSWLR